MTWMPSSLRFPAASRLRGLVDVVPIGYGDMLRALGRRAELQVAIGWRVDLVVDDWRVECDSKAFHST